jgi:hypothetical protein
METTKRPMRPVAMNMGCQWFVNERSAEIQLTGDAFNVLSWQRREELAQNANRFGMHVGEKMHDVANQRISQLGCAVFARSCTKTRN